MRTIKEIKNNCGTKKGCVLTKFRIICKKKIK